MFYVKAKISKCAHINAEITDENVFNRCPDCGCEHAVDLVAVIKGGGDLYGTSVYCDECAKRHRVQSQNG